MTRVAIQTGRIKERVNGRDGLISRQNSMVGKNRRE